MKNTWYNITASAKSTDIYVYDEIGLWGVTAQDFVNETKDITGKIKVHINSPGGSVFDGYAIYSHLKGKDVEVYIEGLCASIATVIACAGKKIHMSENSLYMIHPASCGSYGTVKDHEKTIEVLSKINSGILNTYVTRTGMDREKISEMVEAETWLDSAEAKLYGFVDHVEEAMDVAATYTGNVPFKDNEKYQAFLAANMNNIINEDKEEDKEAEMLDDIMKALNVDTEDMILDSISALQDQVIAKEAREVELVAAANSAKIDSLVASGKIATNQVELAKKLLATDETLFNDFLASTTPVAVAQPKEGKQRLVVPVNATVGSTEKAFADLTAEEQEDLYNNFPEKYAALKEAHINNLYAKRN